MSNEKKDGCCDGTAENKSTGGCGCCCKVKKLIFAMVALGLVFMAGMMFAKSCPLGQKVCPYTGAPLNK